MTSFLRDDNEIDFEGAIVEAAQSIGEMPMGLKVQGSVYIVRVLWALEVASRAGIGPLIPARIAEIICVYGGERVEQTNTARFFRDQKRGGDFTHLWKEDPPGHYSISS